MSVNYRWIDGPDATTEEWERIENILLTRGWMSLNRQTSRVLIAEDSDGLCGLHVLQLVPHAEPLWTAPRVRGAEVAQTLAKTMKEYLDEVDARGYLAIADNPLAAKFCESLGMYRVASPVYVFIRGVTH